MLTFYASKAHYIDHLAPIWRTLDPALRGPFLVPEGLRVHAMRRGVMAATMATRAVRADAVCVAGYVDYQAIERGRVVFVEHGAGQTYNGTPSAAVDHPGYAGGRARDAVDLFLVPNRHVAELCEQNYPNAEVAVVGCPKLDPWLPAERHVMPLRPLVAVTFHWNCALVPEAGSAFGEYRDALVALNAADDFDVVATAHPRAWPELSAWYRHHGIAHTAEWEQVLCDADLLVADNTSGMYEFAATGKRVVVLNSRHYRHDVEHGLRFWSHVPGIQVGAPSVLTEVVRSHLRDPTRGEYERGAAARRAYDVRDGTSTARAVEVIERWFD